MMALARMIKDLPSHWSVTKQAWHTIPGAAGDSKFSFVAEPSSARLSICAEPSIVGRIAITNNSADAALQCELALVSCTLVIPGLNTPTALPVKGGGAKTRTDISSRETEYFDLFGALLNPAIDWPERTFLWVPNNPYVPRTASNRGTAIFRLTGSNFPPQTWKGTIAVEQGYAQLMRLEPVSSDREA
jgi:hypothetical protein